MSYRLTLFATSADISVKQFIEELKPTIDVLRGDFTLGSVWVTSIEIQGVRFFRVMSTGLGKTLRRGTYTDGVWYGSFPQAYLGYDDVNGVNLFEYNTPRTSTESGLMLLNDGHILGGHVKHLSIEYPGKGFTVDQLAAISKMDEADMSDAQADAIMNYESAIDIGLRQVFGWTSGRKFLKICHVEEAVLAFGDGSEPFSAARDIFAYFPETPDFRATKVPDRVY